MKPSLSIAEQPKAPEAGHTPLPWHAGVNPSGFVYGQLGEQIAELNFCMDAKEAKANAELIVRAVNSHAELLELLTLALPSIEESEEFDKPHGPKLSKRVRALIESLS